MKSAALKNKPAVAPGALAVDLLHDGWRKFRRAFKACRGQCTEASVHRFRVAMRRLVAAFEVAACAARDPRSSERAQSWLKQQLARLSPLRDAQIQVLQLHRLRGRFPELNEVYETMVRLERKLIHQAQRKLNRTKTAALKRIVQRQHKSLKKQIHGRAARRSAQARLAGSLRAAFVEVMNRRRKIDECDPSTVHRVRVALKKFRYLAEAASPLLKDFRDRDFARLRAWQAKMGQIQDIVVVLNSLHVLTGRRKQRKALSFRRVEETLLSRRAKLIRSLLPALAALPGLRARLPRGGSLPPSSQNGARQVQRG